MILASYLEVCTKFSFILAIGVASVNSLRSGEKYMGWQQMPGGLFTTIVADYETIIKITALQNSIIVVLHCPVCSLFP